MQTPNKLFSNCNNQSRDKLHQTILLSINCAKHRFPPLID